MTTTRRSTHVLVAAIAGIIAACAGASGGGKKASCALAPADTVYLARGPVYRDCAVDKRARVIDRSAPLDFRPSTPAAGGQACYRADVEFVVDATGSGPHRPSS